MDFNRFKEEFINLCKNFHNIIVNSSFFYFIKEKYDNLSLLHRRIIYIASILIFSSVLLYYPFFYLYSSRKNMKDFNIKKKLIKEMTNLSSTKEVNTTKTYPFNQNPVRFIELRMPTLGIHKEQQGEIKKVDALTELKNLPASTKVEAVEVNLKNLNLKEVIQFGHKMENLSNNIKLINMEITENPEKEHYFNVSYILSFFELKTETPNQEKEKVTKDEPNKKENPAASLPKKLKTEQNIKAPPTNENIFDKLKVAPAPSTDYSPQKEIKKENKELPLLKLKKEDLTNTDSKFKNRPIETKKRDLIPALPVKMKDGINPEIPKLPQVEIPPAPKIEDPVMEGIE